MAYNNAIPQPTDRINDSQAPILANFAAIKTVVDVNHVTFDDPSGDQGKHNFVSLPEQAAAPTTLANEGAIYTKEGAKTGITEVAFQRESSGTVIEMTAGTGNATAGWTMLPSGFLIKWMTVSGTAGDQVLTWPTGATIPAFSAVYQTIVTPSRNTGGDPDVAVTYKTSTTTTVTVYNSHRTTLATSAAGFVRVLAIGLP